MTITPPLRGSRREGGARSRAGGGQTDGPGRLLEIGGQTLIQSRRPPEGIDRRVDPGPFREYGFLDLPVLPDLVPSRGPLSAIYTGLEHSGTCECFSGLRHAADQRHGQRSLGGVVRALEDFRSKQRQAAMEQQRGRTKSGATPIPVTGFVLAGGKSARMGRDKGLLEIGGQTLIQSAVGLLKELTDRVVVLSWAGAFVIGEMHRIRVRHTPAAPGPARAPRPGPLTGVASQRHLYRPGAIFPGRL